MPLQSIQFASPYEKLFHQKPDLSHLRVFGCLCYIFTYPIKRFIFQPTAHPYVLLGYPSNHTAYKVLNLTTKKLKW